MTTPLVPAPVSRERKPLLDACGRLYQPAIGPRLKVLLWIIFATFALLSATGGYLAIIRLLETVADQSYTNPFSFWIVIVHILVGVAVLVPFLAFGSTHLLTARGRPNRRAVRLGIFLFIAGLLVCLSGLALIQLDGLPQLPTHALSRQLVYALHLLTPLAAVVLYVLHRRAGPDIQWHWGAAWGAVMALFVAAVSVLHFCKLPQDTLVWHSWSYHLLFGLRFLAVESVLVLGVLLMRRSAGQLPGIFLLAAVGLAWMMPQSQPLLTVAVMLPLAALGIQGLWRRWPAALGAGAGLNLFLVLLWGLALGAPHHEPAVESAEGERYFEPSKGRTWNNKFIDARELMMDTYCLQCHADIYRDHYHSAHHFSSFNNPPYLFSVRESRKIVDAEGKPRAARWCAGCHDPVPFYSGKFDDPNYDDVHDPTAHAGITCVVCHAIERVNSTTGNGDYTLRKPEHYPFAQSEIPALRWFSNQVLKARPEFHKKTFLKPVHRSAEFCSTCHKVSLPVELNSYKEFLRGQDHYTTFLLSGVSGHGARSFYYPPRAKNACSACHMPLKPSNDFGARDFDGSGERKVHDHFFAGGNTGLPALLSLDDRYSPHAADFHKAVEREVAFLHGTDPAGKDRSLRVDLFGLKEGGTIHGKLHAPLRPEIPTLEPGKSYLVEVVIRTIGVGHPFTQGTVDSNEVWVDFQARSGERIIGRSGALAGPNDTGPLDEWAHRINVLMLDRNGKRINRRNPQDIFTPLYNHQIPPGAGQVVHYRLEVPANVRHPIELAVKVRYRKFDFEYMSLVYGGKDRVPRLPVVDLCEDHVLLPVKGGTEAVPTQTSPIEPAWQRWNDYGIGCYIEGGIGEKKGELRQAEEVFAKMTTFDTPEAAANGHVNRARVLIDQGSRRLDEAARDLEAARKLGYRAWWTVAWLNGLVNVQNATQREHFDAAIESFERILDPARQPRQEGFDFTRDFIVINELARTLFRRAQMEMANPQKRDPFLLRAVEQYQRSLEIEPEDLDAHFGLHKCYQVLARVMPRQKAPMEMEATSEDHLLTLCESLSRSSEDRAVRLQAAVRLAVALNTVGSEPINVRQPKRLRLDRLLARLQPYWKQEKDGELRAAAAHVLDALHYQMWNILRPDDLAQARTVQIYRSTHPAADHAAEAIVIYPLTRPD